MLTITTTSANELFTFYTEDTRYDIDWNNDQMFEAGDTEVSGTQFHTFAEAGAHAIRFRNLNDVYINKQADAAKYTVIEQWGTAVWNADMSHAFHGAINLTMNERAGIPNMGTVTNMSYMFAGATSFDQNIAGWNTSTVTDMTSMFQNAASFNRAIDGWDVSSVTNMTSMFFRASAFNQDLDGWNVASVTNMTSMFDGANSFNGDISGWNTALVTDMTSMFAFTTSFNGALGGWNVGTVTSMWNMFAGATAFDQDIGGWNTASVTDMYGMFLGASSFDQDLGGWNVAAVRYMESMFSGVTLSLAHYDSLLVGWNRQELTPGVTFDGGTSLYISDEAQTARGNMISSAGWTITDGGLGTMNQAPTNIFLSSRSISENVVAFAEVGTLSNTDAGGTYVYTLESGDGATDNGSFDILGTTLGLTTSADYEMKASYSIRINVYDGTNNFAKQFDIAVDQVNEAPTASDATFELAENSTNGTAVGIVVATDPDATSPDNVLTYAITGGNAGDVFAISPTTGAVAVADSLNYETTASYSLEVTVTDGGSPSLSSTAMLTITVTDVDDNVPVFTSRANESVLEGTTAVTTVTARDANAGQTVITFLPELMGADAGLFTITTEGVLTFTTAPDYESPVSATGSNIYTVTVTATDGQSVPLTATQTFTVTVTDANEHAPVFTAGGTVAVAYAENGTTAVTTVGVTDADTEQTVGLALSGGADVLKFSITPAGALTFNRVPDYENPADTERNNIYKVIVTATDGQDAAQTATQTLNITVTGVNEHAPLFTRVADVEVPEGSTVAATITAADADAQQPVTFLTTLSGDDADMFSITTTGELTFNTVPDYEHPGSVSGTNVYTVTVTATDGQEPALTAVRTFTITVTDVVSENAPVFTSGSEVNVLENSSIATTVTATDADTGETETLMFTLTGGADARLFTLTPAGELRFKTVPDYEDPADADEDNRYEVIVTVTDGRERTMRTLTITVTNENDNAPVFTRGTAMVEVLEGMLVATTVTATDADAGQTVTFLTTLSGADAGLLSITTSGELTFTTAPDYENPGSASGSNVYTVAVTATDGQVPAQTTLQTFTITVTDVENEHAPVFPDEVTVDVVEGTTAVTMVIATDADAGQTVTFLTTLSGADAGLFSITTSGELTFTTAPDYENPGSASGSNVYTVAVTATDGQVPAQTTLQTFTITVTDVENEHAPVFPDEVTVDVVEGTTAVTMVIATDADAGQTVTFLTTLSGADAGLFSITTSGELTFTTAPDYENPGSASGSNVYTVAVTATDGQVPAQTTLQTFTITVTDVENEHAPVFPDEVTVDVVEGTTAVTMVIATDADAGQTVSFTLTGGADMGLFSITTEGVLTFNKAPAYAQPADTDGDNRYEVIVTATDGQPSPLTATQTLTITVTEVKNEHAPVFTSEMTVDVVEGTTAVTTVTATDADTGQPVSFTLTGGADEFLFTLTPAGVLTFNTAPDYEMPTDTGTDNMYEVTITATDNGTPAMTATQALTITVTDMNDNAPVFTGGATATVTYAENATTAVTTVVATDADTGQTITLTLSGADAGLFSITPAGELTFNTAPDFEVPMDMGTDNVYEVTIMATDNGTPEMATTQTLTITVTDVDDVPTGLESFTGIAVYPNPAGAVLHISGVEGNARYTLSGIDGKVLKRGMLEAGTADHSVAIPSLNKGIYLLQLTTGKGSITRKIVKE